MSKISRLIVTFMLIFSGSSHTHFASKLAKQLNANSGDLDIQQFPNGEKRLRILTDANNQDCVIVQSFTKPVDEQIIELVMMADALERSGAKEITAVIPWMGYSLQDKVFREGEPLAARVVADIVSNAYIHRVILVDLHNPSIAGFFSEPTVHLRALKLFVEYAKEHFAIDQAIVVSPDFGGLKVSRLFAEQLGIGLVNVDKHRDLSSGEVSTVGLAGDVRDKICLVYDDVINTGGTVVEVARLLKQQGAREVHFLVTHGLFAGEGLAKMNDEAIDSVVITDSVEHANLPKKVKVISVVELVAGALR